MGDQNATIERMTEQPFQDPNKEQSFEAGLAELEAVVKELETEGLPLERAILIFEKGVTLSDRCRKQLEDAESKIEILTKRGLKLVPQPFDTE